MGTLRDLSLIRESKMMDHWINQGDLKVFRKL